jgi:inhibitor of KinA sporulation pathway (predicted exonuclease)
VKVLRARLRKQVQQTKPVDPTDPSSVLAAQATQARVAADTGLPPYVCVLDFEATCVEGVESKSFPHEIIEMPVVIIDRVTREVVDSFRGYVRPTHNPVLSPFCTRLTGIEQGVVDGAEPFTAVYEQMLRWLRDKHGLLPDPPALPRCSFATDGPWDIRDFLRIQFALSGIGRLPKLFHSWINIRKHYSKFYGVRWEGSAIEGMLTGLGLRFEGRPHCGLDDTTNLGRIVVQLLEDGCRLEPNDRLSLYHNKRVREVQEHLATGKIQRPELQHADGAAAGADGADAVQQSRVVGGLPVLTAGVSRGRGADDGGDGGCGVGGGAPPLDGRGADGI